MSFEETHDEAKERFSGFEVHRNLPTGDFRELTPEEVEERYRVISICDTCCRESCSELSGTTDQMTQPNGKPCGGKFISVEEYETRRVARCPGVDVDGEQCTRYDLVCSRDPKQEHLRADYRTFPRALMSNEQETTDVEKLIDFAKLLYGDNLLPWQIEILKVAFDPEGPKYHFIMVPQGRKN